MRRISKQKKKHNELYIKNRNEYVKERMEINGGLCERCNARSGEELHHKAQRHGVLAWLKDYFAWLCRDCHRTIHLQTTQAEMDGWIIRLNQQQRNELRDKHLHEAYENNTPDRK